MTLHALVHRVVDATPPTRDRAVDGLRALAIGGVVLGHWMVTALVTDGGTVRGASPLRFLPHLAPVSWLLQTLAVFFLVGGYTAGRPRTVPYRRWLAARLARLLRPVPPLLAVWAVVAGVLLATGAADRTVHTLVKLVLSPLWFLLVFAALTAAAPLVARLHWQWPLSVVAAVDVLRFGPLGPQWIGWVNLAAGWLVPFCLGIAWSRGTLTGGGSDPAAVRRTGWRLLLGGAAATVVLVRWFGYPASMVGVPGAGLSNLNPPTLAAVTFGLAQCGLALLLLGPLRAVLDRPRVWAGVALLNLSAMTVFLWHQTAMIAVTLLVDGTRPGLHTVPDTPGWMAARIMWLPAFALVLAACWAAFHRFERR
ncbi:acyltransferase family protein [Dactylosporangium aurantiacum]|uniref:Acyltransferase family protein n=1 Tax=Dactylosporangium aurantiacum TaxID=35754 RepID=A0A9Q9I953_9ACTN|nr:acyltransferase family protein [Dactylosporangium aurantiacum]MDG6107172.1 acyltransferase family protein [Dactylosporangium aurantiacum]UWZ51466.1 acyltransferase family protein [Dactylosporangium aurantiacum]